MTRGVPSDQTRSGWWYSASREEKLAQVDGCIELGMTMKQCAMNCGCLHHDGKGWGTAISSFAHYHGRTFTSDDEGKANNLARKARAVRLRQIDVADAKKAYLSGEPVDFWSAR